MDNKQLELALRQLNQEYALLLKSPEYRNGKRLLKYRSLFSHLSFRKFWKQLRISHLNRKASALFSDLPSMNVPVGFSAPFHLEHPDGDYSVTVYTCIVGRYDLPKAPLLHYPNYSFVLFTDLQVTDDCGWEVRPLPDLPDMTAREINRYLKLHPDEYFESDYAVYMDGNIRLLTGVGDYISCINESSGLAIFDHPYRDCLYREADVCLLLGKGHADRIRSQVSRYHLEGFPEHYGLKEATIIVSDLHNAAALKLLHCWWDEFLLSKSGRDQLSLPFVLWKSGLTIDTIGSLGANIRDDTHLQISYHNTESGGPK